MMFCLSSRFSTRAFETDREALYLSGVKRKFGKDSYCIMPYTIVCVRGGAEVLR